ncbi:BatA domain-containing protein, partial [bacterium]|nr:BatA domain-containing protein [bacterium]
MNFLNPVFLWSLIGVGVPFAIHFFGRKKNKNLPFSYIKFL